jgi:hypothetical protein
MSTISSFVVEPSPINSGAAVILEVVVNRQGTIIFSFEGNNQPKFSNNTSKLEKAVSSVINEFSTTISGAKGVHEIYAQFTDEPADKRKSFSLTII